jgi:DNA-binding Lrp family transcriptional regulator
MGKANIEIERQNMQKIVKALMGNSRMEINKIAEKTLLSRQTVSNLLKKMEENKTIWGYSIVLDPDFLDVVTFVLLIKLKPQCNKEKVLEQYFKNKKKIPDNDGMFIDSVIVHGKYDLVMILCTKNIQTARRIVFDILDDLITNVDEYELEEAINLKRLCGIVNPNRK